MSSVSKISYSNTLMFTIIAGIISLCVLLFATTPSGKSYYPAVFTFEIGIILVIAYAIYRIITAEKDAKNNSTKLVVDFNTCPDYYTRRQIGTEVYCFNEYNSIDQDGRHMLMKIMPVNVNGTEVIPPQFITPTDDVKDTDYLYEKFDLHAMQKDPSLKTTEDKCKLLYSTPKDKEHKYSHYPDIPWTYAKGRCQSFV